MRRRTPARPPASEQSRIRSGGVRKTRDPGPGREPLGVPPPSGPRPPAGEWAVFGAFLFAVGCGVTGWLDPALRVAGGLVVVAYVVAWWRWREEVCAGLRWLWWRR